MNGKSKAREAIMEIRDLLVEKLLTESSCFDLALPHLSKRSTLVLTGKLHPIRESPLREEFLALHGTIEEKTKTE